jgi:hypothetical protein
MSYVTYDVLRSAEMLNLNGVVAQCHVHDMTGCCLACTFAAHFVAAMDVSGASAQDMLRLAADTFTHVCEDTVCLPTWG